MNTPRTVAQVSAAIAESISYATKIPLGREALLEIEQIISNYCPPPQPLPESEAQNLVRAFRILVKPLADRWAETPAWHACNNKGVAFRDGEIHVRTGLLQDFYALTYGELSEPPQPLPVSGETPTPGRVCPHCNGSLNRYEDPEAVKIITRLAARAEAAELRIKAYLEAVTPEDAWAVVKARELSEDLDSRDYFDAGYKADEARAGDVETMKEALQRVRSFVEYARYELDDGPLVIGHQFPTKDCADKELARIDAALASVPAERTDVNQDTKRTGSGVVEYDGAFFCTLCGANWGAISHPDKPCEHSGERKHDQK